MKCYFPSIDSLLERRHFDDAVSKASYRVLVADDSPEDLFFLARAIQSAAPRFKVVGEVRDGEEVIEYLSGEGIYGDRKEFPMPDLLIMDWRMPRLDGGETLQWLKGHPVEGLKVAILADSSGPAAHTLARELGAQYFFSKARGFDALVSAVRKVHEDCLAGSDETQPPKPMRSSDLYKVLVVDDSEDDRFFLRRSMQENSRFTIVAEVCNGQDAVSYFKGEGVFGDRQQFPLPDLMLLDLKMPGKDGHEVLEWLQAQTFSKPIVVVLTSSIRAEDLARSLDLGADAYHIKTVDPDEQRALLRELERLLERHPRVN